jgi:hypothetical protein
LYIISHFVNRSKSNPPDPSMISFQITLSWKFESIRYWYTKVFLNLYDIPSVCGSPIKSFKIKTLLLSAFGQKVKKKIHKIRKICINIYYLYYKHKYILYILLEVLKYGYPFSFKLSKSTFFLHLV